MGYQRRGTWGMTFSPCPRNYRLKMQTALTDKYESDTLLQTSKFRLLPCSRPKKKMINMKPVKTVQKAKKYKKSAIFPRITTSMCRKKSKTNTNLPKVDDFSKCRERAFRKEKSSTKYMSEAFF